MTDSPTQSELRQLLALIESGNARIEDIGRDVDATHRSIKTLETAINGSIDGSRKGLREAVRDNGFRIKELRERSGYALEAAASEANMTIKALSVRVSACESNVAALSAKFDAAALEAAKIRDAAVKEDKADRQWMWNTAFAVISIILAVLAFLK